jgi:GPH family glycoside/pentoside/hexuronide:cation symporter
MANETAAKTEILQLQPTTEIRKIIYGSPRLGINLFMGMVDFGLLFLYKEVYLLNPILVGIALTIGKVSIAAAQFLVAWLSDHTQTRWGRRKPFLIILAPILAFSFIMLLLPGLILGATPPEMTLFGWFAGFNGLAQSCYSVTSVYHSWTAEQFPVQERPRVSQIQNVFNFIGMGVIIIFTLLVLTGVKEQLKADPTDIPPIFLTFILAFAVIMIGLIYLCAFYMPTERTPIYQSEYKKELNLLVHDKNFMSVTFVHGFGSLGWAMVNGVMMGYITIVLMMQGMNLYISAGILFISLLGTLEIWRRLIEKKGKKATLLMVFGFGAITFPFSLLGLFPWAVSVVFGVFIAFCLATAQAGWALFPYILYADLAQDFERRHGELKAGLFTGFPSIMLNFFQAIALFVSGFVLSLPDVENVPGNAFTLGYVLWGPICSVIFLLTVLFIKKHINLDFSWEKKQ